MKNPDSPEPAENIVLPKSLNLQDIELMKDKATKKFEFTGLLLGLLVNAITTIKFNDYGQLASILMKFLFLGTAFCFAICILFGLSTFRMSTVDNIKDISDDLETSNKWFVRGFVALFSVIPVMLYGANINVLMIFVCLIIIVVFFENHVNRK
jgi:cytochrome bd-type quinol oxidase subunit 2